MASDAHPAAVFEPFANDTDVLSIHGDALTITNDPLRIVVAGSLELTRDKVGLAAALALGDAIGRVVERLRADAALPETVAQELPAVSGRVRNPFI